MHFTKLQETNSIVMKSFADRSRARVVLLQGGDEETIRLWQVLVDESTRYFNEVYQLLGRIISRR